VKVTQIVTLLQAVYLRWKDKKHVRWGSGYTMHNQRAIKLLHRLRNKKSTRPVIIGAQS
jgi:hypothetical protein